MKEERGITLIALIITIIILIILTAITISNVMNSNLFGLAKGAAENYTQAGKEEQDKIDELVEALDGSGVGEDSNVKAGEIVTKTEKDNYTDADGRTATIPQGFKVSTNADEQNIKSGLVIQDTEGNEFVWVPCYVGKKPEGTADDVQEYKDHEYVENDLWKEANYKKYNDWEDEAAEKYGNSSVSTYGGFYIGRYEAGWSEYDTSLFTGDSHQYIVSEEEEIKKKNETAITENKKPVIKANVFAWNFISQPNAKTVSERMYEKNETAGHANSYLVDGTAWDTVTNWIAKDADVTDSTEYGNYAENGSEYTGWYAEHVVSSQMPQKTGGVLGWLYTTKFKNGPIRLYGEKLTEDQWEKKAKDIANKDNDTNTTNNSLGTKIEIPTGSYEDFKFKNIYDLGGNVSEWTTEVGNRDGAADFLDECPFAVRRGQSFHNNTGSICFRDANHPASLADITIGFRVVLYIK